jgi:hypothetical protein
VSPTIPGDLISFLNGFALTGKFNKDFEECFLITNLRSGVGFPGIVKFFFLISQVLVANACNPSYLGGRDHRRIMV